ncbi:sialate O-acetylesterase [Salmonella enterica]|nr:sialate O-acetylesterase [Salmonella enterica]ELH6006250.1 sialate O-acetylesterase [Salmonella enterica]ELQ9655378.1 sialate O-acetylesterase [Salmonella enterica]ELU8208000.1 sialate O-acetylesterase [Salmonella enterica]EMC5785514.1 sialate O-acetylesterase [Salmonella enterica]
MTDEWQKVKDLGKYSVQVRGGSVLFVDAPYQPVDEQQALEMTPGVISLSVKSKLWIRRVDGEPVVSVSALGVHLLIEQGKTTPPSLTPEPGKEMTPQTATPPSPVTSPAPKAPEYYFVIPVAGQSNMMAYGEGLPLPDTLDAPHPRIKQLARRATVTPGGAACKYNDVIPLDHCPHDVQNMSGQNHPKADLKKGQYGTVGQALHIAKKLLPYIPEEAGILMVPCSRGGAAFTTGDTGTFNAKSGATEASARWGTGKPLYQDLISRTKAALDKNPKNRLLAVVWMQGEFDLQAAFKNHPARFAEMVKQFRTDLADHAAQMPDFKADNVPWICGDTTYYWKNTYPTQYDTVYGGYKTCQEPNVFFVPFLTDENGHNTPTNEPAEDPDIPAANYYGSASRTSANWVSVLRGSHFSSWARRDIIPARLASAILLYAGRKSLLAAPATPAAPSGSALPSTATGTTTAVTTTTNDTAASATLSYTPKVDEVGYNGRRGDGTLQQQGWKSVSGGAFTPKANPDGKGGHVLAITKTPRQSWKAEQPVTDGTDLLKHGGVLECKFRLTTAKVANQYALACYWLLNRADVPAGINFVGATTDTHPALAYFFIQTDGTNINLMAHTSPENIKMGTFGAYNTDWHTFKVEYHGGNTSQATLYIDGDGGRDITLRNCPANTPVNTVQLTDITSSNTYGIELAAFSASVYRDDATLTLKDTDASSYVYFPAGKRGGKVVIPDAKISAGNTVQIVANNAGTITVQPASGNVLINGLPSSTTTDHSTTLVQTGTDGKSWVTT